MIRTTIESAAPSEAKRQRSAEKENVNQDLLSVEEYLTNRCDSLSKDIHNHAELLVSKLRQEFETQAAELRAAAAADSKGLAAMKYELSVVAQTPAGQGEPSAYAGSKWNFTLLPGTAIAIGRSKAKKFLSGGISLPKDNGVSTSHAKIELREGRLLYTDLGSSNGTFLNGKELTEHKDTELASGDKLILGDTELIVTLTTTAVVVSASSPVR